MASYCPRCRHQFDITLFQFGRPVVCPCGYVMTGPGSTIGADAGPSGLEADRPLPVSPAGYPIDERQALARRLGVRRSKLGMWIPEGFAACPVDGELLTPQLEYLCDPSGEMSLRLVVRCKSCGRSARFCYRIDADGTPDPFPPG